MGRKVVYFSYFYFQHWAASLSLSEASAVFRLVDSLMMWVKTRMKPARWTPWGRNTASSAEKGTLVSCFAWYETRWEALVNLFCCMTETLVCCLSKYSCGPFSPLVTLIGEDKVNFRFSHNACFIHLSDPFNILEATNVILKQLVVLLLLL